MKTQTGLLISILFLLTTACSLRAQTVFDPPAWEIQDTAIVPCDTDGRDGFSFVAIDPIDDLDCTTGGGTADRHLCVCNYDEGVYKANPSGGGDAVQRSGDTMTGPLVVDGATVHVINGGTATTLDPNTDVAVQGSATAGDSGMLSLIGGNAGFSILNFGDTDVERRGDIYYNHTSESMVLRTNGLNTALTIDSLQNTTVNGLSASSLSLVTPLAISEGGTSATSASGARATLGLANHDFIDVDGVGDVFFTGGANLNADDISAGDIFASGTLSLNNPLGLLYGGTGAATASGARVNLGLGDLSTINSPLLLANGGTSSTDASGARAIFGIANHDFIDVDGVGDVFFTGGANLNADDISVDDIFASGNLTLNNPLALLYGGTGASTASGARTNLGLGSLSTINSPLPLANGGTSSTDASGARAVLGIANHNFIDVDGVGDVIFTGGANLNADDISVDDIFASGTLSLNNPLDLLYGGTGATTASAARTNLGLGSLSTINSPLPLANGGTSATSASGARAVLGIVNHDFIDVDGVGDVFFTGGANLNADDISAGDIFASGTLATNGNVTLGDDATDTVTANGKEWWITGGTSDMRFRMNDGSGRMNLYYNSNGGSAPLSLDAGEDALRIYGHVGDPTWSLQGWNDAGGGAGASQSWSGMYTAQIAGGHFFYVGGALKAQIDSTGIFMPAPATGFSSTLCGDGAGSTYIYYCSSTEKVKEQISNLTTNDAYNQLFALSPRSFRWKFSDGASPGDADIGGPEAGKKPGRPPNSEIPGRAALGFIAEEVGQVDQRLVRGDETPQLNTDGLVAISIAVLQDLVTRVEALEAELLAVRVPNPRNSRIASSVE